MDRRTDTKTMFACASASRALMVASRGDAGRRDPFRTRATTQNSIARAHTSGSARRERVGARSLCSFDAMGRATRTRRRQPPFGVARRGGERWIGTPRTTAETASSLATEDGRDADAIAMATKVSELMKLIEGTDGGMRMEDEERSSADALIGELGVAGAKSTVAPNDDEQIFGYYDVSYVSVGKNQVGQPAGGRFRSPLGRFLFKTIGLEQNLFAPNRIENRVAFTLLGCLPGEVTLEGTFEPLAEANDGRTVKASFNPPGISVAGGPKLRIGPKSSVVLSTTYLDDRVRLGVGSRGSLFVFTRKTEEQAIRDHRRWGIGGFAIALMLFTALALGISGVHQLRTSNQTLYACTVIAAALLCLAMAYILRDGGIVAEDADVPLETPVELTEEQKDFLTRGRDQGEGKSENVFANRD